MNGSDLASVGQRLVPLAALSASALVVYWYRRYRAIRSGAIVWKVVAAGVLAGRLAFVLQNWDTYSGDLAKVFDMRDGGFASMAALFAAFVLGAELTRNAAPLRRPVFAAALAGAVVWIFGTVATLDFAPARTSVPLVEVRRLDGTPVQLRTFASGPMVVNLWATWCPPCRREMPLLRDAQRRYPGISFVFVNQGESPAVINQFLASERLDIANVFTDRAKETGSRTGAFAFPTTLFFDREGRLFMRQVGELHGDTLDERLAMLMKAN